MFKSEVEGGRTSSPPSTRGTPPATAKKVNAYRIKDEKETPDDDRILSISKGISVMKEVMDRLKEAGMDDDDDTDENSNTKPMLKSATVEIPKSKLQQEPQPITEDTIQPHNNFVSIMTGGGRFDFDDGGTYCGGWEDGKAHGNGVCTGPKGMGEYSGAWQHGFEHLGVYTWPSGNCYGGQWTQGKRHGIGTEAKGKWLYRGEWTQGFKGRYGVRQSTNSGAKYEGTWTTGLQDGYGVETYADGDLIPVGPSMINRDRNANRTVNRQSVYQGQWLRGMRHGYGVRQSVPYGLASHYRPKGIRDSMTSLRSENEDDQQVRERDRKLDETRGGFVLKAKGEEDLHRRSIFGPGGSGSTKHSSLRKNIFSGLKLRKQKSTGDINDSPRRPGGSIRSTVSNMSHTSGDSGHSNLTTNSHHTDSNLSFFSQDDILDMNCTETYMGEWKNDKRSGFGISERTDGLKYEGEWFNNKKHGYGVTSFKDGTREEGKYKNNVLISSGKKTKLILIRSNKLRERVDSSVMAAQRAAQIAMQKADIAVSRMANARVQAERADMSALQARKESDTARLKAKELAPEFHQPGTLVLKNKLKELDGVVDMENLKAVPLENNMPHHRSKSMMLKRANGEGVRNGEGTKTPMSALSSALDCAIAGSSPRTSQRLNPNGNPRIGNHVQRSGDSSPSGSMARSPSTRNRRYSFEGKQLLSELNTSAVLTDHFDQYSRMRDDSGLGREIYNNEDRYTNEQVQHNDRSPDSGVHETDYNRLGSLQRRKTMPSIVKGEPNKSLPPKSADTVHSSENINPEDSDIFIIENGIRKRVRAETNTKPTPTPAAIPKRTMDDIKVERPLLSRYKMEPARKGGLGLSRGVDRGSLPDVSKVGTENIMPRAEAAKLSSARRQEVQRLAEEEQRRKEGELVLRLSDLKDWVEERQLLMLVIGVNVTLATMFFNLLS
ncbi:unnamed protein product [Owenia fusiformis]|uniref:Uncharacterized protein n=1 Tax=Owenia fusiformis TaxID=6347 RepID=A0A8J1Y9H3_OWEFU|nr:unnamed protein product [Owenia fusiformis]